MFELKPLSREGIPGALSKAERYRFLNQPWEAESAYRDVLDVDPNNQDALTGLLLAITDQFDQAAPGSLRQAREILPRLDDEYARAYYGGIICERRAKALHQQARRGSANMVYDLLYQAKDCYEQAEALRPAGNDEVLLRWNACVRLLQRYPEIAVAPVERYQPYGDA